MSPGAIRPYNQKVSFHWAFYLNRIGYLNVRFHMDKPHTPILVVENKSCLPNRKKAFNENAI